jgi:iron complex transport system ATP-binding protein
MLEVNQIAYKIANKSIVNNISFKVEKGEMIALVGPNGAGKSTLLKLISKELTPSKGNIKLNGNDLQNISFKNLAKERAVLTQSNFIALDYKVDEVVMMGRFAYKNLPESLNDEKIVDHVLEICGIKHLQHKSINALSGGEQQRVHFARTLAQIYNEENNLPKLLLLDEPLNNLDIKYQHHILEIAKEFAEKGNIVICVLHDLNLAATYCDRILMLQNGNLVEDGTVKKVFKAPLLKDVFDCNVEVHYLGNQQHPHIIFGNYHFKNTINQLVNQ